MLPIYIVLGFLQIFAKHNNYNIKKEDLKIDIRVRRHIENNQKPILHAPYDFEHLRDRRYTAYPYIPRYNYTNAETKPHNSTNIFNQTWNYIFNKTKRYFSGDVKNNQTGYTSGYKNNVYLRSYPYAYPPGYGARNILVNTGGDTTPYFYNYQNPNGRNFGGYYGVNGSRISNQNLVNTNNITRQNTSYPSGYTPYIIRPNNNTGYPNNNNYNIPKYNYNQPISGNNPFNYSIPVDNPVTYNPSSMNYNPYNPSNYNISDYNPSSYSQPGYNAGYNPPGYSVPLAPYPVTTVTPVTTSTQKIMACVICNIPCPAFFQRFGKLCVPKNTDDDY